MYGKLFNSMFDGSLATRGPWEAMVTFMTFIALADKHGHVDMTLEVIQRRTLIPMAVLAKGIKALSAPDPHSRNPSFEGRRIALLRDNTAWGWRILNYREYSQIRSSDERAAYQQQYYEGRDERVQQRGKTLASFTKDHPGVEREWLVWCESERPDLNAVETMKMFYDHWTANANQRNAKKIDWTAAWRNWVRKERVRKADERAPKKEKWTCDYCDAARVGVTGGINHCRKHTNDALDGKPRRRT